MIEYVVGFYFSPDKERVALIRKTKPEWQKGRLNGVGGKVEPNELPIQAMVREMYEESGIYDFSWRCFLTLSDKEKNDWIVYFYETSGINQITKGLTEEEVSWYKVKSIVKGKELTINNLRWIIPLALDKHKVTLEGYETI